MAASIPGVSWGSVIVVAARQIAEEREDRGFELRAVPLGKRGWGTGARAGGH
jgi:hypothetical protein